MHFEQVPLEQVKEQIARGEVSLMSLADDAPCSCGERISERRVQPEEGGMNGEEKEQWMRLDELAVEPDREKPLTLVKEINRSLEKKQR